jgi:hypothetical protein
MDNYDLADPGAGKDKGGSNMKKRLLSVILVLVLAVGLLPAAGLADGRHSDSDGRYSGDVTGGYIYYDKDTGDVIDCDSTVTSVEIPDEFIIA